MGYSAGTLDLSVLGTSESAVASIDKTVKSLNSLYRSIQYIEKTNLDKVFDKLKQSAEKFSEIFNSVDLSGFNKLAAIGQVGKDIKSIANGVSKLNTSQTVFAAEQLSLLFENLAKATKFLDKEALYALSSVGKSLSSISNISKLNDIDWNAVGSGFNKLSVTITPFLEKVKEAEASLTALYGVLSKSSGKKIGNLLNGDTTNGSPKSSKNLLGKLLRAGSWTAVLHIARRLGGAVAKIVQAGSDYTETLNLWQVAMRNNLDMAEEFVNKMNKAYGISSKTVMKAQATFKNMIGSLGQIDDATAYKISEALVQMSADFSSLYNVKLESAFQKMQAMLAGQVRPIRSAGLDMTETTLYQYYQALGGTKAMRQLNRTEKQLLSILAVYKQMGSAGALGDMTKTLNLFANQNRMMTEYWSELKVWSGLILKDLLDQGQVLIYINAALITATEIIKSIAKSKGLGEENFIDGLFETTEATNEEIDKLQGKLTDFDKFRSLDQGDNNVLGIDQKLLEALSGYSSKIDEAQNDAQKLAQTWLENINFDNLNWSDLTQYFIDAVAKGLNSINDWVDTFNWGELGSNVAQHISSADWGKVIIEALKLPVYLFKAFWEFFTNFGEMLGRALVEALSLDFMLKDLITNIFGENIYNKLVEKGIVAPPQYALGGLPDKGTMFVAGEAGAEMVYNMPSGQSGVANVKQIEQAMYNALARHSAEGNEPIVVQAYLDGEKVYENTTSRAKSRGKVWANV